MDKKLQVIFFIFLFLLSYFLVNTLPLLFNTFIRLNLVMSFNNNSTIIRGQQYYQHYNNKPEFTISPPILSPQHQHQFDTTTTIHHHHNSHKEEDCWDSVSTIEESSVFSSPSSPSSSSLSSCSSINNSMNNLSAVSSNYINEKTNKMSISNLLNKDHDNNNATKTRSSSSSFSFASFRRKKQKPTQSLPSSTRGTFSMPAFFSQPNNARSLLMPPPVYYHQTFSPSSYQSSNVYQQRSHYAPPRNATTTTVKSRNSKHDHQPRSSSSSKDCATSLASEVNNCLSSSYVTKTAANGHNGNDNNYNKTHNDFRANDTIPPINHNQQLDTTMSFSNQIKQEQEESNNSFSPAGANMEVEVEDDSQISKKAKTNAAYIYDNLSADCDPLLLFQNHQEWIPKLEVFNKRPMVRISWKGKAVVKFVKFYAQRIN